MRTLYWDRLNATLRLDLSSGVLGLDPEGSAAVRSSLVTCVVSCDSGAIDAEGDGAEDAVCATDLLGRMSRQLSLENAKQRSSHTPVHG